MRALRCGGLAIAIALLVFAQRAHAAPTWQQFGKKLTAAQGVREARFGTAVALDGNTLVIGAPGPSWTEAGAGAAQRGATYVFERVDESSPWVQTAALANPGKRGGSFGWSVAVRGDVLVVGAPAPVQIGVSRINSTGEVFIYERAAGAWTLAAAFSDIASLDPSLGYGGGEVGTAVALDDHVVVAGAPSGDGAVVVLEKVDGAWKPTRSLSDPASATSVTTFQSVGFSIGIGNGTIVTGAHGPSGTQRAADAVWSFTPPSYAPASVDNQSGCFTAEYGKALAVDGDTVVVGGHDAAPTAENYHSEQGLVAFYTLSQLVDGTSPLVIYSPRFGGCAGDSGVAAGDGFGTAVAVRGDVAVVGAPGDLPAPGGAAHVYRRDAGKWSPTPLALRADEPFAGDQFGASVAVSVSTRTLVVGAPAKSTDTANDGAAYVFRYALPNGDGCASGAECHSGSCVDGVCCADACGGGRSDDCVACSVAAGGAKDGECTPALPSVVCRPAAGECDVDDRCDGTSRQCSADVTRPNGAACASGVCLAGACTALGGDAGATSVANGSTDGASGCATASNADATWLGALVAAAIAASVARRRRTR